MDRSTERTIKKALALIRKGDHAKARPMLTELLKQDPSVAEAWYLLSYTVPEQGRRIYALRQALNVDPEFSRAQQRLNKVTGVQAESPAPARTSQQPEDRAPAPAFVEPGEKPPAGERDAQGFTEEEKGWDQQAEFDGEPRRGSRLARVLLGVLGLFIVLAAIYFLAGDALRGALGGGPRATATEAAAFRTLPPTWTPAGDITATPEAAASSTPEAGASSSLGFATPDSAVRALMNEIRAEVLAVRGLDSGAEADDYVITRDQAVSLLEELYLGQDVSAAIAREQDVLAALGLVPADYFLVDYELSSQVDQLGGFYVTALDSIFVIGEDFSGMGPFIYAHEYEHALADEHFDLASLGPEECSVLSDQCRAIVALVEGDATALSRRWLTSFANPEVVDEVLVSFFGQLDAMLVQAQPPPPFISMDVAFPYEAGERFVDSLINAGGWQAIDAAFLAPPASTEQILHPEKYMAGEAARPLDAVDFSGALAPEWQPLMDGRLGEWMTYLLLWLGPSQAETLADEAAAANGAAGWGNDVIQTYQHADDRVLLSAHWLWDSAADAEEMQAAMESQLTVRFGEPSAPVGEGQCWTGADLVSCLYIAGEQTLWLQGPDADTLSAVLALYVQFD